MPEGKIAPRLPQIGRLLELPEISAYFPVLSRTLAAQAVSLSIGRARERILAGGIAPTDEESIAEAARSCAALAARRLRRTLNGTGVLLHTNMGRSP
ncbi:MAG: hypothetical protein Q8M76_10230, partial [Spirochaetaceae bacterium]|nr:hypothetical protein [Spirochaetaceae bacterium]